MLKILVADDDQEVLDLYRAILGVEDSDLTLDDPDLAILDDFIEELMAEAPSDTGEERQPSPDFEVVLVSQGIDAVHAAQKALQEGGPFSHAFLDMRMPPGIDGLQTAIALREIDSAIQIIFVSAYFDYFEEELDAALGTRWRYLQKPFMKASIMGMLEENEQSTGNG